LGWSGGLGVGRRFPWVDMSISKSKATFFVAFAAFGCGGLIASTVHRGESRAALAADAEAMEHEFADSGSIAKIPRVVVAKALYDYLGILEKDPHSADAYLGAVHCYLILDAKREALELRRRAKSAGVSLKDIDGEFEAFGVKR